MVGRSIIARIPTSLPQILSDTSTSNHKTLHLEIVIYQNTVVKERINVMPELDFIQLQK